MHVTLSPLAQIARPNDSFVVGRRIIGVVALALLFGLVLEDLADVLGELHVELFEVFFVLAAAFLGPESGLLGAVRRPLSAVLGAVRVCRAAELGTEGAVLRSAPTFVLAPRVGGVLLLLAAAVALPRLLGDTLELVLGSALAVSVRRLDLFESDQQLALVHRDELAVRQQVVLVDPLGGDRAHDHPAQLQLGEGFAHALEVCGRILGVRQTRQKLKKRRQVLDALNPRAQTHLVREPDVDQEVLALLLGCVLLEDLQEEFVLAQREANQAFAIAARLVVGRPTDADLGNDEAPASAGRLAE